MIEKRVFIVGCPRSGTTLLQSILGCSPHVFTLPETHFFNELYSPKNRLLRGLAGERALVRLTTMHPQLAPYKPRFFWSYRKVTKRFQEWMDAQALSENCSVWLEKTPLHIRYIEQIRRHEAFSEACFVHVLRNMENTVASLLRVGPEWGWPLSVQEAIDVWLDCLRLSMLYVGKPAHYFVRYEALLDNPEQVVHKLYEFVGLQPIQNWQTRLPSSAQRVVAEAELKWKSRNLRGGISREPRPMEDQNQESQMQIKRVAAMLQAIVKDTTE